MSNSSSTAKYKPVKQLDMDEIRALKPVIHNRDLCGIAGCSLNKGLALIKAGTFKSARKMGHTWRLSKAEVLDYFGLVCE